jgi:hypothetical protein
MPKPVGKEPTELTNVELTQEIAALRARRDADPTAFTNDDKARIQMLNRELDARADAGGLGTGLGGGQEAAAPARLTAPPSMPDRIREALKTTSRFTQTEFSQVLSFAPPEVQQQAYDKMLEELDLGKKPIYMAMVGTNLLKKSLQDRQDAGEQIAPHDVLIAPPAMPAPKSRGGAMRGPAPAPKPDEDIDAEMEALSRKKKFSPADVARLKELSRRSYTRTIVNTPLNALDRMDTAELRRMQHHIQDNYNEEVRRNPQMRVLMDNVLNGITGEISRRIRLGGERGTLGPAWELLEDKGSLPKGHPLYRTTRLDIASAPIAKLNEMLRRVEEGHNAELMKPEPDFYLLKQYEVTKDRMIDEYALREEAKDPSLSLGAKADEDFLSQFEKSHNPDEPGESPFYKMSDRKLQEAIPQLFSMTNLELARPDLDEEKAARIARVVGLINQELERRISLQVTTPYGLPERGTEHRWRLEKNFYNALSPQDADWYLANRRVNIDRMTPQERKDYEAALKTEMGFWDTHAKELRAMAEKMGDELLKDKAEREALLADMEKVDKRINEEGIPNVKKIGELAKKEIDEQQMDPYRNLIAGMIIGAIPQIARATGLTRIPGVATLGTAIGRFLVPYLVNRNAPVPMVMAAMNLPILTPERIGNITATIALPFAIRKFKRQAGEFMEGLKSKFKWKRQ